MKDLIENVNVLTSSNLQDYEENFIDYLDVDDLTLRTYKVGIENFKEYLKANGIKVPTRNDIITYRNYLRENYEDNTVNTYMVALRRLFKYLKIHNLFEDLTVDIKGARYTAIPKKQVLTQEQAQTIYKSLTDAREKALFSLFITTGLRGIEVSRAEIEDIKIHNGEVVLWVQCKKRDSKNEYVKLSEQVQADIYNYLDGRTTGNIFISTSNENKGLGISTKSIRKIIKDIFKRFGLDSDTFSCHSLRRSCATFMYNGGADIRQIQEVLHHASPVTTNRYVNAITRNENKSEFMVSNMILGGGA